MRYLPFCLLLLTGFAHGQILVYDLKIKAAPQTPDFDFFQSGKIVIDSSSQKVSFIFISSRNTKSYFVDSRGTGEFFFSSLGEETRGNVRASSTDGSAKAAYLLTGIIDQTTKVLKDGATVTMAVPSCLKGYVMASDSAFFAPAEGSYREQMGIVGIGELTATLSLKESENFNRKSFSVSKAVDYLLADLREAGVSREESILSN